MSEINMYESIKFDAKLLHKNPAEPDQQTCKNEKQKPSMQNQLNILHE